MTAREWAESGPGFSQISREGAVDWALWERLAEQLCRDIGNVPGLDRRVHHLYLPVLFFALARMREAPARPVVVGIQAPQGAGKTTLTRHLLSCLRLLGLRSVSVSIDDFYLTRSEQLDLAAAHPDNPYLEHRGYPGTHDIELGRRTLAALHRLGPEAIGQVVAVPVYDKSAHGGRGDRVPEAQWRRVEGPLDIVFLEGWMLGFERVDEQSLPDPALVEPNRVLASYGSWHRLIDAWVVLRPLDPAFVVGWRVEAEAAARQAGRSALDEVAAEDYVRRFLPAYSVYGDKLPAGGAARLFLLSLDRSRQPVPWPERAGRTS